VTKYQVKVQPSAEKEIGNLDKPGQKKIIKALDALSENPRPTGCKKLVGSPAWRVRVGQYRIIYTIEDKVLRIEIVRVAHRKEVYR
jgi:mRNA interferase RelE/StbE